jgi:thiamine-phosphate pyrophosphorylase
LNEPSVDPDEAETRLYLIGPSDLSAETAFDRLSAVLDIIDPVAFLLPSGADPSGATARDLRELCRDRGTAFFVQDDLELARSLGADGVHQEDPGAIATSRAALAKDQILGAGVGRSRHDAMAAGEDGADYIAFGLRGQGVDEEIIELVSWWRDLFVLPSLAFAETPDEARRLAAAGADFIGVSSAVWDDPTGPAAGAQHMRAAIEKN